MLRLLVLALLASPILCSRPGHRSSVMHEDKPILRLGPDHDDDPILDDAEPEGEPQWVTNLRTSIQKQINDAGFEDAKLAIKATIDEANDVVNGDTSDTGESDQVNSPGPEVRVPVNFSLRNGPGKVDWENDLKYYIMELVRTYGSKNLENFVKPVVRSIERAHHVKIQDIDVNPYGEVSVIYKRSYSNGDSDLYKPESPYYQREGVASERRYTMSPE